MKLIKTLNLYSGIGGNRKYWQNVEVTAVEINPDIAKIYQDFFPDDKVIITDAHQYLLEHYNEYDFIWSSPPCPTHSKLRNNIHVGMGKCKPIFPDMKLYEEIIFLEKAYKTDCVKFKGNYCIENVISYYKPLIKPQELQRHYFWANFHITKRNFNIDKISTIKDRERLSRLFDFNLDKYSGIDKRLVLRNCVNPELGLHIFNCAFPDNHIHIKDYYKQEVLI